MLLFLLFFATVADSFFWLFFSLCLKKGNEERESGRKGELASALGAIVT